MKWLIWIVRNMSFGIYTFTNLETLWTYGLLMPNPNAIVATTTCVRFCIQLLWMAVLRVGDTLHQENKKTTNVGVICISIRPQFSRQLTRYDRIRQWFLLRTIQMPPCLRPFANTHRQFLPTLGACSWWIPPYFESPWILSALLGR